SRASLTRPTGSFWIGCGTVRIVVLNKQDLPRRWSEPIPGHPAVRTSAHTGDGVNAVRAAIASYIRERKPDGAEDSFVVNLRQREALAKAHERLGAALEAFDRGTPHEFVLIDLYSALEAIGALTGEVLTD